MTDDEQELDYGPESHVPAQRPAVPCPGCGGSGKIAPLVTARIHRFESNRTPDTRLILESVCSIELGPGMVSASLVSRSGGS